MSHCDARYRSEEISPSNDRDMCPNLMPLYPRFPSSSGLCKNKPTSSLLLHYPNVLFRFVHNTSAAEQNVLFPLFYICTLHTFLPPCPSLITSNWQHCHSAKDMALDLMHVVCSHHLIQLFIMHRPSYLCVNQWCSCEAKYVTRLPCYVTDSQW